MRQIVFGGEESSGLEMSVEESAGKLSSYRFRASNAVSLTFFKHISRNVSTCNFYERSIWRRRHEF